MEGADIQPRENDNAMQPGGAQERHAARLFQKAGADSEPRSTRSPHLYFDHTALADVQKDRQPLRRWQQRRLRLLGAGEQAPLGPGRSRANEPAASVKAQMIRQLARVEVLPPISKPLTAGVPTATEKQHQTQRPQDAEWIEMDVGPPIHIVAAGVAGRRVRSTAERFGEFICPMDATISLTMSRGEPLAVPQGPAKGY